MIAWSLPEPRKGTEGDDWADLGARIREAAALAVAIHLRTSAASVLRESGEEPRPAGEATR